MVYIFWFSVFVIFYAYFGYPLALYGLSLFRQKRIHRDEQYRPMVSLIITVHNEQDRIHKKIENTLILNYPKKNLEVIFASDASTDKTEGIISSYPQFELVRSAKRKGKEFAQKCAVEQAKGEILIFTDVATMLEPGGISSIVANFSDPTVGCVSSEDRFVDNQGRVSGEGAYVKYEMFLRRLESRVCSLVGLSGSFFAARQEVCMNWAEDLQSDFNTLINAIKMGYRGVSDPLSIGYYQNIADDKKEFQRKVRTVLRGLFVISRNLSVLNVFKYGFFSWEMFSHKICRWLVPYFLALALVSNFLLVNNSGLYLLLLMAQLLFYVLAILYYFGQFYNQVWLIKFINFFNPLKSLCSICYYFVVVNTAILMAWIKYFKGEQAVFWEPSKR